LVLCGNIKYISGSKKSFIKGNASILWSDLHKRQTIYSSIYNKMVPIGKYWSYGNVSEFKIDGLKRH
jgi:hypothetical protein